MLTAEVQDASGSAVTGVTISWTSSDTSVATVSSGGRVAAMHPGTVSITATGVDTKPLPTPASVSVTVVPGPPASLAITTQPAGTWLGSALDSAPVVAVRDRLGNPVQDGVLVYAAVPLGTQSTLSGDTVVPTVSGVARFDDLGIAGTSKTPVLLFRVQNGPEIQSASLSLAALPAGSGFKIDLTGPEETVLDVGQFGMYHTPDGRMSFRWAGDDLRVWFPCAVSTCFLHGPSSTALTPLESGGQPVPTVFGPTGKATDFDGDYAAITSILRSTNGHDLIGIYQAEQHPCGTAIPFKQAFGVARSADGGITWTREGQIASSDEAPPSPGDCSWGRYGPGNPSVTRTRDGTYLLVYFDDGLINEPDEIYLARASAASDGAPGSWTRYVSGAFGPPLLSGALGDTVIHLQKPISWSNATQIGSVSWNAFLGCYIATLMAMDGFYYATSTDGVTWTTPQLLVNEHSWNDPNISSDTQVAEYPSLLSFDQSSDQTTSRTGYLYYARSTKSNDPPHHMVRRPFVITPVN